MHEVCTYVRMYVCMYSMYVDISQQYVCMHVHHISQSIDQPSKVANPVRGQLCTHASVQLHLYTSDTSNHVPWVHTHSLSSVCTHAKVQKVLQYTCKLKHPCTLTRCTVPVANTEHCTSTNTHVRYVRRSGCLCQTLYSYKHSAYVQARSLMYTPPRLSMPYTAHVHVQCARPSTQAYAQSVHRQTIYAKHWTRKVKCVHSSTRAPVH